MLVAEWRSVCRYNSSELVNAFALLKRVNASCRSKYENEVVKLTVLIEEPIMKVFEKDVSSTFTDQLGVLGTIRHNSFFYIN